MSDIQLHLGDCLDVMAGLPDGSVDAVICDLPYGTTACAWDVVIPFKPLWDHYRRLLKPRGVVALTASQPFTAMLTLSNMAWFKYSLVWEKSSPTGVLDCEFRPLKAHEDIAVFSPAGCSNGSKPPMRYTPQMGQGKPYVAERGNQVETRGSLTRSTVIRTPTVNTGTRYPRSVLYFPCDKSGLHPTQKPVPLMEYLIRTYSSEGDTVLDNTMGSGTTGVACVNTARNFIGIEKDPEIFGIAEQRIADARLRLDRPHAPPLRLKATADACSLFDALEAS